MALAATVACGSLIVGVALGRVFSRWRFWGRPLFFALLLAPAVIPPAFTALGLLGLFDPSGPRVWRSLARVVFAPEVAERAWPWLVWTWAALIQGVALVLLHHCLGDPCAGPRPGRRGTAGRCESTTNLVVTHLAGGPSLGRDRRQSHFHAYIG